MVAEFRLVLAVLIALLGSMQLAPLVGDVSHDGRHAAELRVISANLRMGGADPDSFVEMARSRADVITVSELTRTAVTELDRAGLKREFPYSILIPKAGAAGIGMWSRYPLTNLIPQGFRHTTVVMGRVQLPGVSAPPIVASIHLINPLAYSGTSFTAWNDGIAALKVALRRLGQAAAGGSVFVAGDFNATPDMYQFRQLLAEGYRDAAEQVGVGFVPTFPNSRWLPAVVSIDHILVRQAAVTSMRTDVVNGSDHLSLTASFTIPEPAQP